MISLVCILAGVGAGLTTGFVGLSAAVFITPMLSAFLNVPFYDAVGVALASDILGSAVSAWTYKKNGNLDIKNGRGFMVAVWIFAVVGSIASFFLSKLGNGAGDTALSYWSLGSTTLLGVSLVLNAKKEKKLPNTPPSKSKRIFILLAGGYIGFVCGFQGVGGGMMLLLALTLLMRYEYKTAVGTSVFIMSLTALIGSASHFAINGLPNLTILFITVLSTTIFARIGAWIGTKVSSSTLKIITGIFLIISTICLLIIKIVKS